MLVIPSNYLNEVEYVVQLIALPIMIEDTGRVVQVVAEDEEAVAEVLRRDNIPFQYR